jgi:hypothetical protein
MNKIIELYTILKEEWSKKTINFLTAFKKKSIGHRTKICLLSMRLVGELIYSFNLKSKESNREDKNFRKEQVLNRTS